MSSLMLAHAHLDAQHAVLLWWAAILPCGFGISRLRCECLTNAFQVPMRGVRMHADAASTTAASISRMASEKRDSSELQLLAAQQHDILKRTLRPECVFALPAHLGLNPSLLNVFGASSPLQILRLLPS